MSISFRRHPRHLMSLLAELERHQTRPDLLSAGFHVTRHRMWLGSAMA